MQNGSGANTARLGDYFTLLRRHWLVVLLCLALGVGAALAYLQWAPKEYRSTTSVLVTAMETDSSSERNSAINLDTEAQLVTSTQTVSRAADAMGISAGTAADRISVSVPPNTEILDLTYVAGTAADAQKGSRAFADAYLAQRQANGQRVLDAQADALQDRIDALQEQLDATDKAAAALPADSIARSRAEDAASRLDQQLSTLESNQSRLRTETLTPGNVVTEPRLPSSPSSPDPLITIAAGVLLGALLGLGLAALRHRRDDIIRTPDDLFRRTGVPVAAVLSTPLRSDQVTVLKPLSTDGRGYARLRNLVATSLEESDRRIVLVAGVRRGGGPVAANLAASLARSGEQVYLVCADVFGPTATGLLGREGAPGLAEVLGGELPLDEATRALPSLPNLRILTPGRDPDRADALLQTRGPRKLVDDLLATASYVVIEAPPTTDSPDAQTLAGVADLAVLVVEAGQSSAREVLDAVAQVESMNAAVLGAVIARYGRDADPDTGRQPSDAVASEEDDIDRGSRQDPDEDADKDADGRDATDRTEGARGDDVPATASAVEQVTVVQPAPAAPPVPNGATAASVPSVPEFDDEDDDDVEEEPTTVLPAGGRPQLVPPGSAGPARR